MTDVLNSLCQAAGVAGHWDSGNATWKLAIYRALSQLGAARGCCVHRESPPPLDPGEGAEWLFDMCWTRGEVGTIGLTGVEFAFELEWSTGEYEFLYDFGKLLVARSPMKAMAVQVNARWTFESLFGAANAGIAAVGGIAPGEQLLLAAYVHPNLEVEHPGCVCGVRHRLYRHALPHQDGHTVVQPLIQLG